MRLVLACDDCTEPNGLLFGLTDATRDTLFAVFVSIIIVSFCVWVAFPEGSRTGRVATIVGLAAIVIGGAGIGQSQMYA